MKSDFKEYPKKNKTMGLYYSLSLIISFAIIIVLAWIFRIHDITWILVSAVVCTELDKEQAKSVIFKRIIATLLGVIIACMVLLILGPGYLGLICGIIIINLICH